jgi:hypothetical protein
MNIQLNEQEANSLILILDCAVRAKGLEFAGTASIVYDRIKVAHADELKKAETKAALTKESPKKAAS